MEPRFYTVDDRPVLLAGTRSFVLDLRTGRLEHDTGGFALTSRPGADVMVHDAAEFWSLVVDVLVDLPLAWEPHGSAEHPWQFDGWVIRVGDFPEEPLYLMTRDGEDLVGLDDWPAGWTRPYRY